MKPLKHFPSRLDLAILGLLVLLAFSWPASASDVAREKRWANEIIPSLVVGEPVYLTQSNKHKFLAIYTESPTKQNAVIVVHGMGIHPDWGLIRTLRQRLNDFGYTTLSIQMPILASTATFNEYPPLFPEAAQRIRIAVDHLKKQGFKHISIVSHSLGSRMTRVYMLQYPNQIDVWVSLSLTRGDTYQGIKTPILDLYGANDLDHVTSTATKRLHSLRGKKMNKQIRLPNANHFFAGQEESMVTAVKTYLANTLGEKK